MQAHALRPVIHVLTTNFATAQEQRFASVGHLSYIIIMIVFDASTLILLAKVDLLDLFLDNYPAEVVIPRTVETECVVPPARPDTILIRERIQERRMRVDDVQDTAAVQRLIDDFHIGHGEAEAVALALERQEELVATQVHYRNWHPHSYDGKRLDPCR